MDPYETLGIDQDADDKTIKRAYRRAAQKAHPDRENGDEKTFHQVQLAYEVLSDPDRRSRYDQTGDTGEQRSAVHEAEAKVVEIFNHIIDSGEPGDLMEQARDRVRYARDCNSKEEIKTQRSVEKFEKLLGRVKTKDQDNLFQMVLQQKLDDSRSRLSAIQRAHHVIEQMDDILATYSDEKPDRDKPRSRDEELMRSVLSGGFFNQFKHDPFGL